MVSDVLEWKGGFLLRVDYQPFLLLILLRREDVPSSQFAALCGRLAAISVGELCDSRMKRYFPLIFANGTMLVVESPRRRIAFAKLCF